MGATPCSHAGATVATALSAARRVSATSSSRFNTRMAANTCVESTGRFAMELGYHVTLVRDATAAFSAEMMHAAHELNGPTFAHAIVTTSELVDTLSAQHAPAR